MALTIHLGAHKTASTHLQQSLKVAQDALQAGGVFLADPSMLRDEGPIPLAQALAEGPGRAGDKASREALARLRDACPHLLEHYDGPQQVNVGSGTDVTIREIADTIASVVGYAGETHWDTAKPDGTPQKLLDVSKLAEAGWTAKIGLHEGIERTVAWYRDHVKDLRE